MSEIDMKFTDDMVALLKSLIGLTITAFRAEEFHFSNDVYGQVELITDTGSVFINNTLHVVDYFGAPEDICFLDVSLTRSIPEDDNNIVMVTTPINRNVKEIRLVQDRQDMIVSEEEHHTLLFTAGIIFVMEDGYELSFEHTNPFVEVIAVSRGKDLINSYVPVDSFIDPDDDCISESVERTIEILS